MRSLASGMPEAENAGRDQITIEFQASLRIEVDEKTESRVSPAVRTKESLSARPYLVSAERECRARARARERTHADMTRY